MIRNVLFALLLATPLAAQTIPERLDQYLRARTELGQFSGTVLVAHDGKVLLRKAYGYANLEHLVANTPETKFEIASLTKAFTAFAIHDLARQGKVKLDAPFCEYFPACAEAWKAITVAQLVHHTSGIPDYEESLEMGTKEYYDTLMRDDSAAWAVEWARPRPLDFAPGSKFKYSNTAYLMLGLIIERVSGRSYEDFLRERLFAPLKMTSTTHVDRTRVQRGRAEGYTHQAPLYDLVGGIALTSAHLRRVPALRMEPPQGDGGLLSTVDDLHLWARALLGHGGLEPAVVRELLAPSGPGGYAFGWFIGKRYDRDRINHNGVLPGMVSQFDIYPQTSTIVIVLCNLDRARLSNISRDLTNIVFERPYDVARSHKIGAPVDAARAARLIGDYKLADGRLMTIAHDKENGWLEAAVKDQFSAGLLPESELVYYAPMWEGTVTFVENGLVMRQAGVDIRGERVK